MSPFPLPRPPALALLGAFVVLTLAACAPPATTVVTPTAPGDDYATHEAFDTPAAREVERAAHEAFHRMELGRLQLGFYTTNVLVDLDLPRGSRVTVEAFSDDSYRLRLSSEAALEAAWLVTPDGVQRVAP